MEAFLLALQFLTRIPVNTRTNVDGPTLGRSVLFYPLVGLLLGALLSALATLLADSPAPLTAALLLAAWVLLTGGLHLDGLADCADAWVGGFGSRERSLKIMKDPTAGPIAIASLVLVLLLKWASLSALLATNSGLPLLFAPMIGRTAILLLMLSTPYVSPSGLAEQMLSHLPTTAAKTVVLFASSVALMALGGLSVFLAGLILLIVRRAALIRLDGSTGDVYGAAVELTETAALVAIAL